MDLPQAVKWYAYLGSQPGWSEYSWHRVKQLARDFPEVFGPLPALVTAEIKARRGGNEPHEPNQGRPR